jgi:hypothetical protein
MMRQQPKILSLLRPRNLMRLLRRLLRNLMRLPPLYLRFLKSMHLPLSSQKQLPPLQTEGRSGLFPGRKQG